MKYVFKKINRILIIFDVAIMVAIVCILFFSFLSFFNTKIEKTEDYLTQFFAVLKTIYLLAKIAVIHLFVNLIYYIFKKTGEEIGVYNGIF
jgi:uncharacterized protein involved in cysteine biosynthesis